MKAIRQAWLLLVGLALFMSLPAAARPESNPAGQPEAGQQVVAQPNRPSVSDSPEVLPPGLFQLEYGWTRSSFDHSVRENSLGSQARFGVARNLEIRWGWDHFLRESDGHETHRGLGDTFLGAQYQFRHESHRAPALAFAYAIKLPGASREKHLGSGRVDHAFTFLGGKNFGKTTVDFNAVYRLVGREHEPDFDRNAVAILTFARPLKGPVGIIGEVAGESRLNHEEKALATTLWALTYRITPQLVIDGGIEFGLTEHAPRKHVVVGFTYAFGNLYSSWQRARHSRP